MRVVPLGRDAYFSLIPGADALGYFRPPLRRLRTCSRSFGDCSLLIVCLLSASPEFKLRALRLWVGEDVFAFPGG